MNEVIEILNSDNEDFKVIDECTALYNWKYYTSLYNLTKITTIKREQLIAQINKIDPEHKIKSNDSKLKNARKKVPIWLIDRDGSIQLVKNIRNYKKYNISNISYYFDNLVFNFSEGYKEDREYKIVVKKVMIEKLTTIEKKLKQLLDKNRQLEGLDNIYKWNELDEIDSYLDKITEKYSDLLETDI